MSLVNNAGRFASNQDKLGINKSTDPLYKVSNNFAPSSATPKAPSALNDTSKGVYQNHSKASDERVLKPLGQFAGNVRDASEHVMSRYSNPINLNDNADVTGLPGDIAKAAYDAFNQEPQQDSALARRMQRSKEAGKNGNLWDRTVNALQKWNDENPVDLSSRSAFTPITPEEMWGWLTPDSSVSDAANALEGDDARSQNQQQIDLESSYSPTAFTEEIWQPYASKNNLPYESFLDWQMNGTEDEWYNFLIDDAIRNSGWYDWAYDEYGSDGTLSRDQFNNMWQTYKPTTLDEIMDSNSGINLSTYTGTDAGLVENMLSYYASQNPDVGLEGMSEEQVNRLSPEQKLNLFNYDALNRIALEYIAAGEDPNSWFDLWSIPEINYLANLDSMELTADEAGEGVKGTLQEHGHTGDPAELYKYSQASMDKYGVPFEGLLRSISAAAGDPTIYYKDNADRYRIYSDAELAAMTQEQENS